MITFRFKRMDEHSVLWNGILCVKGAYACPAQLTSVTYFSLPGELGRCLNLKWQWKNISTMTSYLKYIPEAGMLCNREVFAKGWYFNSCSLKPLDSRERFAKIKDHLHRTGSISVVKIGEDILLVTPDTKMTEDLGLVQDDQCLHCIVLSRQSRVPAAPKCQTLCDGEEFINTPPSSSILTKDNLHEVFDLRSRYHCSVTLYEDHYHHNKIKKSSSDEKRVAQSTDEHPERKRHKSEHSSCVTGSLDIPLTPVKKHDKLKSKRQRHRSETPRKKGINISPSVKIVTDEAIWLQSHGKFSSDSSRAGTKSPTVKIRENEHEMVPISLQEKENVKNSLSVMAVDEKQEKDQKKRQQFEDWSFPSHNKKKTKVVTEEKKIDKTREKEHTSKKDVKNKVAKLTVLEKKQLESEKVLSQLKLSHAKESFSSLGRIPKKKPKEKLQSSDTIKTDTGSTTERKKEGSSIKETKSSSEKKKDTVDKRRKTKKEMMIEKEGCINISTDHKLDTNVSEPELTYERDNIWDDLCKFKYHPASGEASFLLSKEKCFESIKDDYLTYTSQKIKNRGSSIPIPGFGDLDKLRIIESRERHMKVRRYIRKTEDGLEVKIIDNNEGLELWNNVDCFTAFVKQSLHRVTKYESSLSDIDVFQQLWAEKIHEEELPPNSERKATVDKSNPYDIKIKIKLPVDLPRKSRKTTITESNQLDIDIKPQDDLSHLSEENKQNTDQLRLDNDFNGEENFKGDVSGINDKMCDEEQSRMSVRKMKDEEICEKNSHLAFVPENIPNNESKMITSKSPIQGLESLKPDKPQTEEKVELNKDVKDDSPPKQINLKNKSSKPDLSMTDLAASISFKEDIKTGENEIANHVERADEKSKSSKKKREEITCIKDIKNRTERRNSGERSRHVSGSSKSNNNTQFSFKDVKTDTVSTGCELSAKREGSLQQRLGKIADMTVPADKKTKKSDKRLERQFHPYKKDDRPKRSNVPTWSFDIAYNDMEELLQNMTENVFKVEYRKPADIRKWRKGTCKTRLGSVKGRFYGHRFTRSKVPDFLPNYSEAREEDYDINPELISNMEERARQADIVEESWQNVPKEETSFIEEMCIYGQEKEEAKDKSSKEENESVQQTLKPDVTLIIPGMGKTSLYSGEDLSDMEETNQEFLQDNNGKREKLEAVLSPKLEKKIRDEEKKGTEVFDIKKESNKMWHEIKFSSESHNQPCVMLANKRERIDSNASCQLKPVSVKVEKVKDKGKTKDEKETPMEEDETKINLVVKAKGFSKQDKHPSPERNKSIQSNRHRELRILSSDSDICLDWSDEDILKEEAELEDDDNETFVVIDTVEDYGSDTTEYKYETQGCGSDTLENQEVATLDYLPHISKNPKKSTVVNESQTQKILKETTQGCGSHTQENQKDSTQGCRSHAQKVAIEACWSHIPENKKDAIEVCSPHDLENQKNATKDCGSYIQEDQKVATQGCGTKSQKNQEDANQDLGSHDQENQIDATQACAPYTKENYTGVTQGCGSHVQESREDAIQGYGSHTQESQKDVTQGCWSHTPESQEDAIQGCGSHTQESQEDAIQGYGSHTQESQKDVTQGCGSHTQESQKDVTQGCGSHTPENQKDTTLGCGSHTQKNQKSATQGFGSNTRANQKDSVLGCGSFFPINCDTSERNKKEVENYDKQITSTVSIEADPNNQEPVSNTKLVPYICESDGNDSEDEYNSEFYSTVDEITDCENSTHSGLEDVMAIFRYKVSDSSSKVTISKVSDGNETVEKVDSDHYSLDDEVSECNQSNFLNTEKIEIKRTLSLPQVFFSNEDSKTQNTDDNTENSKKEIKLESDTKCELFNDCRYSFIDDIQDVTENLSSTALEVYNDKDESIKTQKVVVDVECTEKNRGSPVVLTEDYSHQNSEKDSDTSGTTAEDEKEYNYVPVSELEETTPNFMPGIDDVENQEAIHVVVPDIKVSLSPVDETLQTKAEQILTHDLALIEKKIELDATAQGQKSCYYLECNQAIGTEKEIQNYQDFSQLDSSCSAEKNDSPNRLITLDDTSYSLINEDTRCMSDIDNSKVRDESYLTRKHSPFAKISTYLSATCCDSIMNYGNVSITTITDKELTKPVTDSENKENIAIKSGDEVAATSLIERCSQNRGEMELIERENENKLETDLKVKVRTMREKHDQHDHYLSVSNEAYKERIEQKNKVETISDSSNRVNLMQDINVLNGSITHLKNSSQSNEETALKAENNYEKNESKLEQAYREFQISLALDNKESSYKFKDYDSSIDRMLLGAKGKECEFSQQNLKKHMLQNDKADADMVNRHDMFINTKPLQDEVLEITTDDDSQISELNIPQETISSDLEQTSNNESFNSETQVKILDEYNSDSSKSITDSEKQYAIKIKPIDNPDRFQSPKYRVRNDQINVVIDESSFHKPSPTWESFYSDKLSCNNERISTKCSHNISDLLKTNLSTLRNKVKKKKKLKNKPRSNSASTQNMPFLPEPSISTMSTMPLVSCSVTTGPSHSVMSTASSCAYSSKTLSCATTLKNISTVKEALSSSPHCPALSTALSGTTMNTLSSVTSSLPTTSLCAVSAVTTASSAVYSTSTEVPSSKTTITSLSNTTTSAAPSTATSSNSPTVSAISSGPHVSPISPASSDSTLNTLLSATTCVNSPQSNVATSLSLINFHPYNSAEWPMVAPYSAYPGYGVYPTTVTTAINDIGTYTHSSQNLMPHTSYNYSSHDYNLWYFNYYTPAQHHQWYGSFYPMWPFRPGPSGNRRDASRPRSGMRSYWNSY